MTTLLKIFIPSQEVEDIDESETIDEYDGLVARDLTILVKRFADEFDIVSASTFKCTELL